MTDHLRARPPIWDRALATSSSRRCAESPARPLRHAGLLVGGDQRDHTDIQNANYGVLTTALTPKTSYTLLQSYLDQ